LISALFGLSKMLPSSLLNTLKIGNTACLCSLQIRDTALISALFDFSKTLLDTLKIRGTACLCSLQIRDTACLCSLQIGDTALISALFSLSKMLPSSLLDTIQIGKTAVFGIPE
jgi:hypothetical protein